MQFGRGTHEAVVARDRCERPQLAQGGTAHG